MIVSRIISWYWFIRYRYEDAWSEMKVWDRELGWKGRLYVIGLALLMIWGFSTLADMDNEEEDSFGNEN